MTLANGLAYSSLILKPEKECDYINDVFYKHLNTFTSREYSWIRIILKTTRFTYSNFLTLENCSISKKIQKLFIFSTLKKSEVMGVSSQHNLELMFISLFVLISVLEALRSFLFDSWEYEK